MWAGVLTVSDSCFNGEAEDKSGPLLTSLLRSKGYLVVEQSIVADNRIEIENILRDWSDSSKLDFILTTGGTGFTKRDVTPEATKSILDREAPGIATALISQSIKLTPMAMISRLVAGIRKSTLIINFPGSVKACDECFHIVEPVFHHIICQLRDNRIDVTEHHKQIQEQLKSKVKLESVGSRPRRSPHDMISADVAINRVITEIIAIQDIEYISINDSDRLNDRILAKDVSAQIAVPSYRASVKDGYAVIASDGTGQRKVISGLTAGPTSDSNVLKPGYCIRISTGAVVPNGADSVVQVEDTSLVALTTDGDEALIEILKEPKVGQDIRPIGSDVKMGTTVANAGTQLGPIELGLMASVGFHSVPLLRRPVVAILSTGDEIRNPGQPLSFGQIWDSNRITLLSLLNQNCVDIIDLGIAKDNIDDIFNRMRRGLNAADVLITTGGVSMGEKDLIKQIIRTDFNAEIQFGRVNLKPGKPTTFATCLLNDSKKYIFGLPGNPISAFVTFQLFVKPLIIRLSGKMCAEDSSVDIITYQSTLNVKLHTDSNVYPLDERPEFARAVLSYQSDDMPTARLTGNQSSSRLLSAKDADVLVLLPAKNDIMKTIKSGDIVTALLI